MTWKKTCAGDIGEPFKITRIPIPAPVDVPEPVTVPDDEPVLVPA